jgi:hypothetical protein
MELEIAIHKLFIWINNNLLTSIIQVITIILEEVFILQNKLTIQINTNLKMQIII